MSDFLAVKSTFASVIATQTTIYYKVTGTDGNITELRILSAVTHNN